MVGDVFRKVLTPPSSPSGVVTLVFVEITVTR
jgi:hypothetical protein